MKMDLHVISCPNGYCFVGNIPVKLAQIVPATKSDVMGQRAFRDENGNLMTYRFPVFQTQQEAVDFAKSHSYEAKIPQKL